MSRWSDNLGDVPARRGSLLGVGKGVNVHQSHTRLGTGTCVQFAWTDGKDATKPSRENESDLNEDYAMNIWAMCIKPNCEPEYAAFEWCRKNNYVGIAWALNPDTETEKDPLDMYRRTYPGKRLSGAFKSFAKDMQPGDFAFLQKAGQSWCCKILDDWNAFKLPEKSLLNGLQLGSLRGAKWIEVSPLMVPGDVRRAHIRGGACRRVRHPDRISGYVNSLYDYCAVSGPLVLAVPSVCNNDLLVGRLDKIEASALFALADWDETEDIVCTYLQSKGWRLQKSFASRSLAKIESVFLKAEQGALSVATVQVKSGEHESIDVSSFLNLSEEYSKIYLFSTASTPYTNRPSGDQANRFELLEQSDIFDHFRRNALELPRSLQMKLMFSSGWH